MSNPDRTQIAQPSGTRLAKASASKSEAVGVVFPSQNPALRDFPVAEVGVGRFSSGKTRPWRVRQWQNSRTCVARAMPGRHGLFAPNSEIFPYRLGLTQPFDICQALAVNPLLFSCPTPCFLVKPLSIDQPLVISLVKPFLP